MLVTNHEKNLEMEVVIPTEWTLMTLKVNGEEKTVKLVDDPETTDKNEALLEAGTHYTFSLKVGQDVESANALTRAAQTAEVLDVTLQLVSVTERDM